MGLSEVEISDCMSNDHIKYRILETIKGTMFDRLLLLKSVLRKLSVWLKIIKLKQVRFYPT